jgi:exodeoxyribonuclease V beta subunit
MIEEAFSYKLGTTGLSIKEVSDKMHEMEFNLKIKNPVIVAESISNILERHYGGSHPFTLASKELGTIEEGYLKGFIDLFFFADNKFWILDYKTNKVADYSNCDTPEDMNNALLLSMAQNHYYLQYLIYLVAIKRYLEQFINITQATEILGGAIYYYVKGVYVSDKSIAGGVYLDTTCKEVVAELDNLFL